MIRAWQLFSRGVGAVSQFFGYLSGVAIVASAAVVTYNVIWRYYLEHPHNWALEVNVFLLVGATFGAAAYTQRRRGHVGTEVLDLFLPERWIPWRILIGDVLSAAVCAFIAAHTSSYTAKAWALGWKTSSTWAPPLWIPFFLVSAGLWLITLQYTVQIVEQFGRLVGIRLEAPDE